ncbi:MAG: hypothetical protein KBD56_05035 [Candidatus Eisenbacteria bacterium]|nr:hypothetical protein [Candidatus Eisenbacteria bacterium]
MTNSSPTPGKEALRSTAFARTAHALSARHGRPASTRTGMPSFLRITFVAVTIAWCAAGMLSETALAQGPHGSPPAAEPGPAGPFPDALDEALALGSMNRSDLGWQARGWWERYPEDIPYKLRHFDDLCAEPLAVVPFARVMGASLTKTLAPENVAGAKGERGAGALYRSLHDLGVNKRYGATRAFSANLTAIPVALDSALTAAWIAEDRAVRFHSFGNDSPYPNVTGDLRNACADLPREVSEILGKLVLDLLDARHWAKLAFRRVDLEMRARIALRLDLGAEETDALEYEPAMDDAAREWDEASLWYAGLKTVEALDLARLSLQEIQRERPAEWNALPPGLHIEIPTPAGLVIVDGTGGSHIVVPETGALLVIDLGGDDRYAGPVGGSRPGQEIGAALDLSGDDDYDARDGAQGAGLTGIGILLDASGDDHYAAATLAQGAGHFGLGALFDLEGNDSYEARYSGQGAGFFGIGLLADLSGDDAYVLWSDGQGFGGVAGVGVLADRAGDDTYLAIPDPAVTGRASYHTELKVAVSNAQGCAMGRRGDGSDGHSWAGGLGAILDAQGDDTYTAGNWAQGCGYWFGTGLMWDGAGDDEYRANGWASGSGAHFCIGAVIDEAGNDVHAVAQNWGPAFGHDFTVAILYDAAGDDLYECGGEGVGHSINRSVTLCLEGAGDDRYEFTNPERRPGLAAFDARFLDRTGPSVYWTESSSVGLFLDAGGSDQYPAGLANDSEITDDPAGDNARARNRGIFVDRATGRIDLDRPHGGHRR